MNGAAKLSVVSFSLIYLLLLVVLFIMRRAKVDKTRLLIIASVRMTVQMVLVGFILQYILGNPHPVFVILFLASMVAFSIHRALAKHRDLNRRFKLYVAGALSLSGLTVLAYFVCAVVGKSFFDAQFTIPLAGMIIGNSMTGVSLALKTLTEGVDGGRKQIEALLNLGVPPREILHPFLSTALETALLPTINSMLGLGIIFLPGMMTGQILSGTLPTTAIMYQIAVIIANCTSVCLTTFFSLSLGYRTMYNGRNQYIGYRKEQ